MMTRKAKRKVPEIVLREGVPTSVIIDIDEYREILERLEDAEDLKLIENIKKTPLKFRSLDDFLKEYNPSA
jgi:PHD/YefM family antitoxin component YafN of YafNO toxin-antitoxin module